MRGGYAEIQGDPIPPPVRPVALGAPPTLPLTLSLSLALSLTLSLTLTLTLTLTVNPNPNPNQLTLTLTLTRHWELTPAEIDAIQATFPYPEP